MSSGLELRHIAVIGTGPMGASLAAITSRHLPSMAHDVRAGRPTEVTQLDEQITERGRELGVATPTHDAVLDPALVFDGRAARSPGTEAIGRR